MVYNENVVNFQEFTSEVSEKKQLNDKVIFARFKLLSPASIDFQAGQYVTIKIQNNLTRSYSVYSPPTQKDAIDVVVDVTPGGPGSDFFKNLQIGQKVSFFGPLGKFVFKPIKNKIMFVATGTGFSPICSMINNFVKDRIEEYPSVKLLYGVSYLKDAVGIQILKKIKEENSHFDFTMCISREKQEDSFSGHVNDYLSQNEAKIDFLGTHFYCCGNRDMVREVVDFLKSKNVPEEQISTELY